MIRRHGVALAVSSLIFAAMLSPLVGGFTDDGFIHAQYARNIIERGEYSFNPGEPSFGTTSPLWVMALAAAGSFFEARDALVTIGQVLSVLAGFGVLAAAYALALALGASRFFAALAAAVLAADVWLARWTALGMESSVAALGVVLMALASVQWYGSRRRSLMFGAFAALAALVRPEVYLALPVFLVAWASTRRRAPARNAGAALAAAALLLLPWLVFARAVIGSFLPNTAGAKSGGLVLDPIVLVEKLEPVAKIVASSQGIAAVAVVLSVLVLRSRSVVCSARARFIALWMIALPAAYVVFDMQILSRYLLLITPLVCVLGWTAMEQLLSSVLGARRAVRGTALAAAALAVVVSAVFYARVVVPPSRAFSHDLTHNMRGLAEWLAERSDADAVVAAADIGYLAFYSDRRVLDLGGLVEPVTGELRSRYSYEEIVDRGLYFGLPGYPHVDYLIDRDLERDRFAGSTLAGHRFEKVKETTVRNLGIRKPGPYYYTLYRVTPVEP